MKSIYSLIVLFFLASTQGIYSQNAPVSVIQEIVGNGSEITVSVTVTDFNNIGSCNLQVLYDSDISSCTSVNLETGVGGGLAANTTVPGVITLGWYAWPAITLPDNSEFITLSFSMPDGGLSEIIWDLDYPDKQWSNGDFELLNDEPHSQYYFDGSIFFQSDNAPVTMLSDVAGFPGGSVKIPVTVANFDNIGSFNLSFDYDPTALSYQSFTNDSGFPGLSVDDSSPGVFSVSASIAPGNTGFFLPDNAVLFTVVLNYLGGNSNLTWNDNGLSCQYADYPDFNILNDSPTGEYYFNGSVTEGIRLGITVFLEGPFLGIEMSKTLNENNLLPLLQPYSSTPWYYSGNESAALIPEDVVDWVLIELRETTGDASTATPDKMIAEKAGFLMKDGSVKDLNGTSDLLFPIFSENNLYIVVHHRNHLEAISANPVTILNGEGNYNFSSGESQVLGGQSGHKELASGKWGLVAGDSNADGVIDHLDKQNNWDQSTGSHGYFFSDFSFDSQVNNADKNDFLVLNYNFVSQVP